MQMLSQTKKMPSPFTGSVRVRVCGILKKDNKILLLKHQSIGPTGYLWAPPGGGVEFGHDLQASLRREFMEETNLEIEVGPYLFANEFIDQEHHAIELFFEVTYKSGELILGKDPELASEEQILAEIKYFSSDELNEIPSDAIHNAFHAAKSRDQINDLRGLITFKD